MKDKGKITESQKKSFLSKLKEINSSAQPLALGGLFESETFQHEKLTQLQRRAEKYLTEVPPSTEPQVLMKGFLTLTHNEVANIEKATKGQAHSSSWSEQRKLKGASLLQISRTSVIKIHSETKCIISRLWGINSYESLYLFPRASR